MYDRHDLVRAYLAVLHRGEADLDFGGYDDERTGYNQALKAYYDSLRIGLEQLFGLRLSSRDMPSSKARVFFMFFQRTAMSFLAVTTPSAGTLDSTLLVRKITEAGTQGEHLTRLSQRLDALAEESRQSHLELLDVLLQLILGDRADLTFTADDLKRLGVEVTPPDPSDYPFDGG